MGTFRRPEGANRILFAFFASWAITILLAGFAYRLLLARGRMLLRIEDLERGKQGDSPGLDLGGAPLGAMLQDFELLDLNGNRFTFSRWHGQKTLLIFFDPRCQFCVAMLPQLARLSPQPDSSWPVPIVLTTGDLQENRDLFAAHDVSIPVLLQEDMDVAGLYGVRGTPTGYLVDEHGRTASELLVGAAALLDAAGLAESLPTPNAADYTPANRLGPLSRSRINRNGLSAGTQAPGFRLSSLDGGEIVLEDFRGEQVLLVFSDPHCGPCNQLAPGLKQLHQTVPDLRILMISRGDLEANRAKAREYNLTFPIALQQRWEVSREYAMFATPIGYLIDEAGVIASEVAVGPDAILSLASNYSAKLQPMN